VVFGLIAAVILALAGISLIIFASKIGGWLSSARLAYRKEMRKIRGEECRDGSCVSSWNATALRVGQAFDIWLIRIIGIIFVAGAVYLFVTS
jgi:hypothetical protein